MYILGISAYYHDSAAALIRNGVVVAAAQEERFTRRKQDAAFPGSAVRFCLDAVQGNSVDYVVFYDKPLLKFERLLETYLSFAPKGFASFRAGLPVWAKEKLFLRSLLTKELHTLTGVRFADEQILFSEHHLSHAASAFYPSPFDDAAVLTMDGVGEWATTSVSIGHGRELKIVRDIPFPHSLGLLYSAFTSYAGFRVNSGEYKLMGLAPYGVPRFASTIREHLVDVKPDGSFRLNQRYFNYCTGLSMTNQRFHDLFGRPPRLPEAALDDFHADVAASIQEVTEDITLRMTRALAKETGQKNICLAGGVALNCVANGKIAADGAFENVWIQPAAGDAGGSLGAALAAYHLHVKAERQVQRPDGMSAGSLGPNYSPAEIEAALKAAGARYKVTSDEALFEETARALAEGEVVGWFQGRMEFGPRALGFRSILGDPRRPDMQRKLNLKIKFRESFRPFAPSVLAEEAHAWFDTPAPDSPYMLTVSGVSERHRTMTSLHAETHHKLEHQHLIRSTIPAVTHTDFSSRVQTVHAEQNPRYHRLLKAFHQITDCPMLINTSFNVRNEPIVCTPRDAFACFMATDMDRLVIGNFVLDKTEQDSALAVNYASSFEMD
ncbi:carbamoyltransferase [Pelomonas cellulosilytica]|uniref:Carbamoyltransferase n=1 Tax=Pelomonas cellulosilytica TaxID=2906762 RepID=A0ABS8Y4H0_9BURK|nr:carbamoyltransferase [Pelomonas sp. P8]MCE4558051.1 carbamoyltransferase [Pelomonas sp. P8]